jgi:hypothetical protein
MPNTSEPHRTGTYRITHPATNTSIVVYIERLEKAAGDATGNVGTVCHSRAIVRVGEDSDDCLVLGIGGGRVARISRVLCDLGT